MTEAKQGERDLAKAEAAGSKSAKQQSRLSGRRPER